MTSKESAHAAGMLALSLVPHLSGGWLYMPPREPEDPPWYATLTSPLGAELHIAIGRDGRPARVSVEVGWPAPIDGDFFAPPAEDRPSITVAVTKAPAEIARDITRRLLPTYLPLYAQALDRKRQTQESRDTTYRMACELGALVGDTQPRRPGEYSYTLYPAGGGTIEVAGSTIRLQLDAPTVAAAAAAVRATRQDAGEHP